MSNSLYRLTSPYVHDTSETAKRVTLTNAPTFVTNAPIGVGLLGVLTGYWLPKKDSKCR